MAILPIVTYGHPALRKKARKVGGDENIREFVENMFDTMHNARGIGLAANQVGVLKQIAVVDVSEMEEFEKVKPLVLINPEVVEQEGKCTIEEGCLSIPTVRDEVERAESVKVKHHDLDFNERMFEVDGLLARVVLHEIDHLNGILFIDHLPPGRRKFHKGALTSIKKGELEIPYPVADTEGVL